MLIQTTGELARSERLRIEFQLGKQEVIQQQIELKDLLQRLPIIEEGDKMVVGWELEISYFGDMVRRLQAIRQLIKNPGIIVSAKHEELLHGECLIEELLEELRGLENEINSRF